MASNYPASLDSFDTIASDKKTSDVVGGRTHRQMHNDLGDAIEAVQAELGPNPSGEYLNVAARLDAIDPTDPDSFGTFQSAAATDGTDQTAVIQAELDTMADEGGGTLVLPRGTITLDGILTIPNDGTNTPWRQPPIRIIGQGAHWSGRGTAVIADSGTILDIKGTDTYGKVKTFGLGLLVLQGITFKDSSGGSTPFVYTTNTTLHIDQCAFVGSKLTTACDQDAIVCGGTGTGEGTNAPDAGFQGYGTVISRNYFMGIRRMVVGQTFFNANVIRENTVWANCGSNNSTDGACIELLGHASGNSVGNLITGNLIEMGGYKYAIKLDYAKNNTIGWNGIFDPTANNLGSILCTANAEYNQIFDGYRPGTKDHVINGNGNNVFSNGQNEYITFDSPVQFTNEDLPVLFASGKFTAYNGQTALLELQRTAAGSHTVLLAKRSAAEGTNPGTTILDLNNNGALVLGGSSAGNIQFQDAAGTATYRFTSNGRTWEANGSGATFTINSGTGGSYLDLKNYGVRFYDHNGGPLRAVIGKGGDQIKFGASEDAIVKRAAAGIIDVGKLAVGNSAAATTPGTVTKKIEVFDASGNSLGFVAVYDAIT